MDIHWADILLAAVRVLIVGALFGAGLPALFALGLRLQATGAGETDAEGAATARRPAATATAYVLFGVVIVAVLLGVLFITRHSLNHYFGISVFGG
ncbi:hypothetical protein [Microbacterium dextranolyticum]|uniref:Uncharacterized protein n=1 Tax=Microbacterium dextranolyticum TaxID=36806 RepID=A0A9W6HKT2_9MICO|nr:hypothetical protein [Microbacterium dextranolyticum]MBM7462321.1 hypothetical protein [Microbacterium dextranolyticum]GLJ94571.1 hypothetical protein GCM10017591_06320 [Microbacterium dextranolyticum]